MFKNNNKYITLDNFKYLKNVIKNDAYRFRSLKIGNSYIPLTPSEIAIQLTNRCNIRCKMCMQWGKQGIFKHYPNSNCGDLDISIIQKILDETKTEKSSLHLWGGEPLFHEEWEKISILLEKDRRRITLNTNGILVKEKLNSIKRLGPDLNIVISLDGLEFENDYFRGKGTYNKIIQNISLLVSLKKYGSFQGKIIINTLLNEKLVYVLDAYVAIIADLNVDKLILNYPWYISNKGKAIMDNYIRDNLNLFNNKKKYSWHSFQYFIPKAQIPILKKQLTKIFSINSKLDIRLQPQLEPKEVYHIINCADPFIKDKNDFCLATTNRLSVCADGSVSGCPDFPEFVVGNLHSEKLTEIWNGERYNCLRNLRNKGSWPLPICIKCSLFSKNRI